MRDVFERRKASDKIEKRVEEFEEEEKTVERMVEMLKFMDENEWIENDTIEEVVGIMLKK